MMQLFLAPLDVWLFRNGKPFTAGEDHRAVSLFPPYPSVIQGTLRSHHLFLHKDQVNVFDREAVRAFIGDEQDYKGLRLRGPFIACWDGKTLQRYFPVPADMAPAEGGYHPLRLQKAQQGDRLTSAPTPFLLLSDLPPTKRPGERWLTEQDLLAALGGQSVRAVEESKLFEREARFGIARDDRTRSSREGALYEAEFIRPRENVGLYVEVAGLEDWPPTGVLRMGGEGRGAWYTRLASASPLPSLAECFPDGRLPQSFKVYFATPTFFKRGWLPEDWANFFEPAPQLLAAALNRYESVGGFDWANQTHKPARRYVPAGSVYYFHSATPIRLKDSVLQTNALSDDGAAIGYGQIFLQEVNDVPGN